MTEQEIQDLKDELAEADREIEQWKKDVDVLEAEKATFAKTIKELEAELDEINKDSDMLESMESALAVFADHANWDGTTFKPQDVTILGNYVFPDRFAQAGLDAK